MPNDKEITETPPPKNLLFHVACSAAASLASHPNRVWLNRASLYQSPLATIFESKPYLLKGIFFNLLRGSMMTGTQSFIKNTTQEKWGLFASIIAAAGCGSLVATMVETPFIRKTMTLNTPGTHYPLWRFSPTLTSLYFAREAGFSLAVLTKNDVSPVAQYSLLFSSGWLTAVAHKFVALEATRDSLPKGVTIPDFREGIFSSVKAMARGGVYTHPVFEVPYKNPVTLPAMMRNLMHVSCGANMYLFRLLYLVVFKEAYHMATQVLPPVSITTLPGFFNNPLPREDSEHAESNTNTC